MRLENIDVLTNVYKYNHAIQTGQKAIYRCELGYKLGDLTNFDVKIVLTCLANESHAMWDGPQPRCECT